VIERIEGIFKENKERYGGPWITSELKRLGVSYTGCS
jgi:hypothetical protein